MSDSQFRLIFITGKARHGKDTIANYYVKHYGFQKHMVAQPLKDVCRLIFNFTDAQVNQTEKDTIDERWQVTPRHCLQFIGTELIRKQIGHILPTVGENIWIKCLAEKLKVILTSDPGAKFVISDVRYENEISFLTTELKISSMSIRVVNPRINNPLSSHCSEEQQFETTYTVENDSTFENLYQKIENLMT